VSVYVVCSSFQHRSVVTKMAKPRFAKVDEDELATIMDVLLPIIQ